MKRCWATAATMNVMRKVWVTNGSGERSDCSICGNGKTIIGWSTAEEKGKEPRNEADRRSEQQHKEDEAQVIPEQ